MLLPTALSRSAGGRPKTIFQDQTRSTTIRAASSCHCRMTQFRGLIFGREPNCFMPSKLCSCWIHTVKSHPEDLLQQSPLANEEIALPLPNHSLKHLIQLLGKNVILIGTPPMTGACSFSGRSAPRERVDAERTFSSQSPILELSWMYSVCRTFS